MTTLIAKTSWQDRLSDQWSAIKPLAIALGIGLVAGPLISGFMGWQVMRGTSEARVHASAVDQQAQICAVLARRDTPDPAALNWSARRELAEKFAIMPGREAGEPNVANACAQILARS